MTSSPALRAKPRTARAFTSRRVLASVMVVLGSLGMASCSLPGAGVDVSGDLKLLYAPFSLSNPPRYWQVNQKSDVNPSPLGWEDKDGRIALAARPGMGTFEIGRRTNVIVLASPFLSFDWQFNSAAQVGDVELVLGFRRQAQGSWTESDLGSGKPTMDQEVRIAVGQYEVRYGEWHREYFDLATLYRRYWPDAQADEVRLVWIGIVSGDDHIAAQNSVIHLTHILLSR
ncbi:hypothetical protein [Thalassospira sp.]|uniref:hypothetical protein n=1 Tax=Thalassospira sp. TaxID=1912094 RepID=UPI00257E1E8F|nr:hypothetical protein [Thalassospira sp.]